MSWADEIEEYLPKLETMTKPGVKLKMQSFDYGFMIGFAAIRDHKLGDMEAWKARKFYGVPSKNPFLRVLEKLRLRRVKTAQNTPLKVAQEFAQMLRASDFGRPQSETGSYDWEIMEGGEP